MTTIIASRDPYSEVLDENRRWRPDWFQWISQLERSVYGNKSLQASAANVVNHGADATGTGDSTGIIQDTWNKYGLIYLPRGIYRTTSTLVMPAIAGAGIVGDGSTSSVILADFVGADAIQSNNVFGGQFVGLRITRPTTASAGSGINMHPGSQDNTLLYDLFLSGHQFGLNADGGDSGWGRIQFVRCENNSGHGFQINGQWQILDTFSANNGADGYNVTGGATCGQWRGMASYNNGSTGIAFIGSPGSGNAIERIRLSDCYFLSDANYEMYFDTYGTVPAVLTNVQAILPQSGNGIHVTANNPGFHVTNCLATSPPSSGSAFVWDSTATIFVYGGQFSGGSGANGFIGLHGNASIHGGLFTTLGGGGLSLSLFNPMVNTTVIGCQVLGAPFFANGTGTNYAAGNF